MHLRGSLQVTHSAGYTVQTQLPEQGGLWEMNRVSTATNIHQARSVPWQKQAGTFVQTGFLTKS